MKTIYIVRHAKSSWEYEGIEDIDRPLKKRGITDAYLIANVLKDKIQRPDTFIASCANRALHTGIIFANVFKFPMSHLRVSKSLYSFSDGYLVKTIKAMDDEYDSAIVFSHDHGINTFVNDYGSDTIEHVPTAGIIGIQFDTNHWKNIKKGTTILQEFPKSYKQKKTTIHPLEVQEAKKPPTQDHVQPQTIETSKDKKQNTNELGFKTEFGFNNDSNKQGFIQKIIQYTKRAFGRIKS